LVYPRGRNDFCIIPFDRQKLLGRDEADASARRFGQQYPRDFFHIALAGQMPVVVGTALTHWKLHQRIIGDPTATDYLLRSTKPFHNMGPAACHAQGLPSLGSATLDLDGDHSFLFSKKRGALRLILEASKDTTSFAAREADSRDQCGTLRRRVSLNIKLLPEDS